tara:strand:- start:1466 stop:2170 length:705 start_codon:yes stop_codon:yes gene_type:complete
MDKLEKLPSKKKRGRKPKNNITINNNPIFDSKNDNNLVINLIDNNIDENEGVNNKETSFNSDTSCNLNNDIINNLIKTSELCWNCSETLYSNTCGLPIKLINNVFYTLGDFCSPECACRYSIDTYENNYHEHYSLINLYNNIKKKEDKIYPAGNKLLLKKFGGYLTIDEYRSNFKNNIIVYPYTIPIKTNIENNMNSINNLNNLNNLKLYRKKKSSNIKNSISNIMQLEISSNN